MAKVTRKGLITSFASTMVVLVSIFAMCKLYVKEFFYSNIRHFIEAQLAAIDILLEQSDKKNCDGWFKEMSDEIIDLMKKAGENNKMELLLLDGNEGKGKVITTSSGFTPTYAGRNKKKLKTDKQNRIYSMDFGTQKVMMCEHSLKDKSGSFQAMVSLDEVNEQINVIMWILVTIEGLVLVFVVISNTFFTSSIVNTIWTISRTANKIAKGDFKTRIVKKTNDEVGELCDVINKMAEELGENEKMKNEFISSVSHELRTPLTAIKGWAETVTYEADDKGMLERGMKIIIAETDRLSKMVEGLLDFSRFQNTSSKLEKREVNILTLVADTAWMFEERARREEKKLLFDRGVYMHESVMVMADVNRLKQVLINIIDNALKYTEAGGVIQISSFLGGFDSISYVGVKVTDSGCGIKKEDLEKVKTKFFKANYTKRGSGIGLAVANEIVTLHGGTLNVNSTEGRGTAVEILLPVCGER
ncbi:MAG: HAMP domain-containing histidine kinase [Oscillospiraceae bacterium]|jgi:signal transduction histidine kinase|nr:HAMP domain-containing histidine kinase [Oscillospiraceae bacterium]